MLPALLRRLLQQGALPEALALAKRHEGGPHFKRSLEWLLFTTLDMEGSKCKPGKTGGGGGASMQQQQQQSGLHVLQGGFTAAGAAAGVLGRQGKVCAVRMHAECVQARFHFWRSGAVMLHAYTCLFVSLQLLVFWWVPT